MDYILFNPNVAPLLQGIRPFMAGHGEKLINGTLSIIDMLSSTHGQTALKTLSDLFFPSGNKSNFGRDNQSSSVTTGIGIAIALFLILILLILSFVFLFQDDDPVPPPGDNGNGPAVGN